MPSTFEENLDKSSFKNGAAYAQATAIAKAQEVASRVWQLQSIPSLVIGADTVVEQEGCILEKPANASDAHRMLSRSAKLALLSFKLLDCECLQSARRHYSDAMRASPWKHDSNRRCL